MSDMPQEIALFQKVKNEAARKRLNIKAAFFWCTSKKESLALSRMALAMDEAGFDDEDFARPIRVNLPIVDDLPEEGVFDTAFCDRYQLGDDGMTFALIPGATPLDPHHQEKVVEGTDETIVDGVNTSTGEIVDQTALDNAENTGTTDHDLVIDVNDDENTRYPIVQMSFRKQVLSQYTSDALRYHLTQAEHKEIVTLEMDTDNGYVQNLILAAESVDGIKNLDMPFLWKYTKAVKDVFAPKQRHELSLVLHFTKAWIETTHIDRGTLTKEWIAGNRISKVLPPKIPVKNEEQPPVSTERYKRAIAQNTYNINVESCVARLHPNATPGNITRQQLLDAKGAIDGKDPVQARLIKVLLHITDIMEYDADSVFGVTRAIDWDNNDITVVELRQFAREWLAKNGIYSNGKKSNGYSEWQEDPHAASHSVVPSEEEVSKQKDKPELVKKVGDGVFDVSALMQNSSTHGEKQEAETTSNVQVQETDVDEKQAGNALPPGEDHLGNGETTVTVNTVDVNQNTDFVSQNSDSVKQNEPESPEIVPEPQPVWPTYFEPGRYENLPNDVYHSANGISSTQLKDARISLMFYNIRHVIKTIPREETKAFLFGGHSHAFILEPGKIDAEYAVPVAPPADIIRTTADMTAIIKEHNDSLPALMTPEEIKTWIEEHNATLTPPLSLSAGAEDTANLYMSLPEEFQRIPEGTKHTATAQKACIKEYNASLQPMLKLSGTRDQLLDQISTVSPELAEAERAKPTPLNTSGSRAQLIEAVRQIRPDAMLADDFEAEQERIRAGRTYISLDMYQHVKAIEKAVFEHPSASRLLDHPNRQSEVSYFGFDEETGLEVRVRPDLEIQLSHARIGGDLKTIDLGNVKQERLRDRLHREIIERDYHLSAAMYCDVANLDQFFWIFVNKTPGYHWVAVVEASPDLLALGRLEYRRTLRMINEAMETNYWPAPIEDDYTDELNDFDLRRLEALGAM